LRAACALRQRVALARAPRVGVASLQAVRAGFAAPGSGQEAWRCRKPFLRLVVELEPAFAQGGLTRPSNARATLPSRRSCSCALSSCLFSIAVNYCFRQAPAPAFLFQLIWRMSPDFWRDVPQQVTDPNWLQQLAGVSEISERCPAHDVVRLSLAPIANLHKIRVCPCAMKLTVTLLAALAIGALSSCVSPRAYVDAAEIEIINNHTAVNHQIGEAAKAAIARKDWAAVESLRQSFYEGERSKEAALAALDHERDRILVRDQISALNSIGTELRLQRQF
jgi:hypothetical protein